MPVLHSEGSQPGAGQEYQAEMKLFLVSEMRQLNPE